MGKCIVIIPNSKRKYVCANTDTAIRVAKRNEGAKIKLLTDNQSDAADIMAEQHRNRD